VFQAVRGDGGNLHDSIEASLITADLENSGLLNPGTLGAALSHRALWQQAAAGSTGFLILEDDLVSDPELAAWISAHHPQLLRHGLTHLINTDSLLTMMSAHGLQETRVFHPKHPDQSLINTALSRTALSEIEVS
jgi:GR25 family glycosyltransferase involved in LPS biosynthesis